MDIQPGMQAESMMESPVPINLKNEVMCVLKLAVQKAMLREAAPIHGLASQTATTDVSSASTRQFMRLFRERWRIPSLPVSIVGASCVRAMADFRGGLHGEGSFWS